MDHSRASAFEQERRRLVSIAYGLLGSRSDAEDAVQEAWLRFQDAAATVSDAPAWLTTVVSRIALDRLRSAQRKRELYVGEWLPEPVAALPDPEAREVVRSLLSLGFLHLLEKLSPEERTVFVLREAFERTFAEVAAVLGKSEAACRQLLSRARKRLKQEGASRMRPVPQSLVERCMAALTSGDEQALLSMLAPDAVLYTDGGGKVPAALNPILGADRIMRFFFGLMAKFPGRFTFSPAVVNAQPALAVLLDTRPSVVSFTFDGSHITAFQVVTNPDKLHSWEPSPGTDRIPAEETRTLV